MRYIFKEDKDGHRRGDVIDLDPSDFRLMYWERKQVIEPFFREQTLAIVDPDPVVEAPEPVQAKPKSKRRKR